MRPIHHRCRQVAPVASTAQREQAEVDRLVAMYPDEVVAFDLAWSAIYPHSMNPKDKLLEEIVKVRGKAGRLAQRYYFAAIVEALKYCPELVRRVMGQAEDPEADDLPMFSGDISNVDGCGDNLWDFNPDLGNFTF
jgi:hypothetical protein